MSFEEPEVLVELAGELGEKIDRDVVTEGARLLNGGAQRIGVMRDIVDEELQHGGAIGSSEIGLLQAGLRGGFAHRAVRHTTEGRDALGDRVCLLLEVSGNGIEEFVQLDEMQALDVPVSSLHLCAKIDAAREARIEKRDQSLAVLLRNTYAALVGAGG